MRKSSTANNRLEKVRNIATIPERERERQRENIQGLHVPAKFFLHICKSRSDVCKRLYLFRLHAA